MKLIFTLIITLTSLSLSAQKTTEREYLYLKKGYKTTVESGLDVISGYTVSEIRRQNIENSTMKVFIMERKKDTTLAGFIVTIEINGNTVYYGVPTHDGYGRGDFANLVIGEMPETHARFFAYTMGLIASYNN